MCALLVLEGLAGEPQLQLIDDLCTRVKPPFWGGKIRTWGWRIKCVWLHQHYPTPYEVNQMWQTPLLQCNSCISSYPFHCHAASLCMNFVYFGEVSSKTKFTKKWWVAFHSIHLSTAWQHMHSFNLISQDYWAASDIFCFLWNDLCCMWNEAVTCLRCLHVGLELLCMIFLRESSTERFFQVQNVNENSFSSINISSYITHVSWLHSSVRAKTKKKLYLGFFPALKQTNKEFAIAFCQAGGSHCLT